MRPNPVRLCTSLLLVVLAACGDKSSDPTPTAADPQRGGTVVVVNNSDLENLNSLVSGDKFTQEVNRYMLFLPLVHYSPDLDYIPALAERWELLGDTGVVFHLRRDVRWHDGQPTTARDVVFTYEAAQDPETTFPNAEYFAQWTGVTSPDSFTVQFSFKPHAEPLAGLPFLPIMPAHLLDSIPHARLRNAAFNKAPVGNGPFRFVEYRANDRWVFEANADYPASLGGRPYLDRLVWRPVPDAVAQVTEISTGGADMAVTPPADQYNTLSKQPGLKGLVRGGRQYANVIWNGKIAPLNDPRVRRALAMGIDRQQIINTLRGGHGTLAVGPIGPFHWAYDSTLHALPFNVDSARALLKQAGIEDRNGDGTVDLANGKPFEIEIKLPAGSTINRDMAELIRSNLSAIGVKVTTRPTDMGVMIQDFTSPKRNFQAILLGWESDYRINLRDMFHSDAMSGQFQIASYANPQLDSLIDAVMLVKTRAEAKPIYSQMQRILRDDQPWTYLYYYPDLVVMRERVQGADMDSRGTLVNVQKWWVTDPNAATGNAPNDSAARAPSPDSAPAR